MRRRALQWGVSGDAETLGLGRSLNGLAKESRETPNARFAGWRVRCRTSPHMRRAPRHRHRADGGEEDRFAKNLNICRGFAMFRRTPSRPDSGGSFVPRRIRPRPRDYEISCGNYRKRQTEKSAAQFFSGGGEWISNNVYKFRWRERERKLSPAPRPVGEQECAQVSPRVKCRRVSLLRQQRVP